MLLALSALEPLPTLLPTLLFPGLLPTLCRKSPGNMNPPPLFQADFPTSLETPRLRLAWEREPRRRGEFSCVLLKRKKAESEAQRGKPKGTLESESRIAMLLLVQRPPRHAEL